MKKRRYLVVGGVAGGASAAARLRRNDEDAEIVIFERGPHVSFANCGLPYYVGDVISNEASLLVSSAEKFHAQLRVAVRTRHEVVGIDKANQTIEVVNLESGERTQEAYDALVLSPGAGPIKPPWAGVDLPGIFTLRNIPDSRQIRGWIELRNAKRAVVVGGGFIGLEMAENLHARGLAISLIEAAEHVFPPLDAEMAVFAEEHMREKGVILRLGEPVSHFEAQGESIAVHTAAGSYEADIVILAIGVRPDTTLAKLAGLELGPRGGIEVDAAMRTNDPHIWAVGDAVEKVDVVTGAPALYALAGPANRQGRIAADAITGREAKFRGSQATAVCGIFGMTAAATGANERMLKAAGRKYAKIYLHPRDHAGYYPGSETLRLKVLYDPESGALLGAQGIGLAGVERRNDVFAMALQLGGTVFDLEEAELSYAPQYGSAKDPVNFAGMMAANAIRGQAHFAHWDALPEGARLIDVREPDEWAAGHYPGAEHIPLGQIRDRVPGVDAETNVYVYCKSGLRAYYAVRALRQKGIRAFNLSGGIETYQAMLKAGSVPHQLAV